jgi:hypothetical protein
MASEDFMTVGDARTLLGVSTKKMAALIKSGVLATVADPLDGRVKLVRRSDVAALAARSVKGVA